MIWAWLCWSVMAKPADSVYVLSEVLQQESLARHTKMQDYQIRLQNTNTEKMHAIVDVFFSRAGFLAMLNRYGLGFGVVHDVALGKSMVSRATTETSKWFRLENDKTESWMLVVSKKEIYPIQSPFSLKRNQTLFDSIALILSSCADKTAEIEAPIRRWRGNNCAFGNTWIEWDPRKEYGFRVLASNVPAPLK